VIVFAGEQRAGFEFADICVGRSEFAAEFLQKIFALRRVGLCMSELDVGFNVSRERDELGIGRELFFGTLAFFEDALRFFLIAPEIGAGYAFFERFQPSAVLLRVKDNSARG
jgi:hypothetical protein